MAGYSVLREGFVLSVDEPVSDLNDVFSRIREVAAALAASSTRNVLIDTRFVVDLWDEADIETMATRAQTTLPAGTRMAFLMEPGDRTSRISSLIDKLNAMGLSARAFETEAAAHAWFDELTEEAD